ncbi:MAG: helix-turn-helix transcriptional regulator [Lachnospiraceae bacterium]|nr:helix-turn-helix transcriptional regulator [Lachnospiraceae bacterium]
MDIKELGIFFTEAEMDDFCAIIIDKKKRLGTAFSREDLNKNINVCTNILEASYLSYRLFPSNNSIICFLNYDRDNFSVRAFVGQFRQVICNVDPDSHLCVFYSGAFNSKEELFLEVLFMLEHMDYGLYLGKSRAIPSSFLHLCSEAKAVPLQVDMKESLLMLKSRNYERFNALLSTISRAYAEPYGESNAFHISAMTEQLNAIYAVIKLFFSEQNYKSRFISASLTELLLRYNGTIGILSAATDAINEYFSVFSDVPVSKRKQKHINEMLDYIDANISNVSLSSLSSHFGLTPEYISRLFKTQYNDNFADYLKKKKLEKAASTLRTDMMVTVTELSRELGYESRSYFQSIFKNKYGVTPDAYRKRYHAGTNTD